jgi:hypothetical protein
VPRGEFEGLLGRERRHEKANVATAGRIRQGGALS